MKSSFVTLKKIIGTLLIATTMLCFGACSALKSSSGKPQVVVEIYPFQFIAEQVGGDLIDITNLTPPGVSAHGYELTPEQVAKLTDAKLVIYQRGFQPATDSAVANTDGSNTLEVGSLVELIPYHTKSKSFSGDNNIYNYDTHTWLDFENMQKMAKAVADRLSEIDPDHKDTYQKNLDSFTQKLQAADKKWATTMASCKIRQFVPSHTAFGYLAKRYHLEQIPVAGLSPDQEPSPARIAEIQKLAKQYGLTTIFYETLVSPDLSTSIANDLGLKTDVLDPAAGLTDKSKGSNYFEIMDANLEALKKANKCG